MNSSTPLSPENLKVDVYGVLVGHTWAEVGLLFACINTYKIKKVVEIGVHNGGLSILLAHATEHIPNFHYLAIEIDDNLIKPTVKKLFHPLGNSTLWIEDAWQMTTISRVRHWMTTTAAGPTLIYCDGGNKPKEFGLYAQILNKGDFIAAHDYDYGGYERAEIGPEDVMPVVEQQGLSPIGFPAPYRIFFCERVIK